MIRGDTVYTVNVAKLRIEVGVLDGELQFGYYHVKLHGDRWATRVEAWRVFADAREARDALADKMRERAADLRREANDLENDALHLTLSSPRTPAD